MQCVGWFVSLSYNVTSPIDLFIWLCRAVRKILIARDCNWWRGEFSRAKRMHAPLTWFTSAAALDKRYIIFAHRVNWLIENEQEAAHSPWQTVQMFIYLRLLIKFEVVVSLLLMSPAFGNSFPQHSRLLIFHRESNWFWRIFIYPRSDETWSCY